MHQRRDIKQIQLFSLVMFRRFQIYFFMVDHFTKYGWIVPLKDKKAENILIAFKNELLLIMFLYFFKLIMVQNLKIVC